MKISTDNTELGKDNSEQNADNEDDNEFDDQQLRGSYNDYVPTKVEITKH